MWPSRAGWIGIDVGSHCVKVAQVRRCGSRYELCGAAAISRARPWQGAAWQDSTPLQSGDEIAAALGACDFFRGRAAACMLTMAACEHRHFDVGQAADAVIRKALEQELSADPVTGQRPFEFDFWTVSTDDGKDQGVGVVATPQELTEQVVRDHAAARLQCRALDGLPLVLARAMHMTSPQERKAVAALDWGRRCATFCVMVGKDPVFVRSLKNCELDRIVEAVAKGVGATMEEAESLLMQAGFASLASRRTPPSREASASQAALASVSELTREPLEPLLEELEKTLAFLGTHHRRLTPTSLTLFGAGACVPRAADVLAEQTGLPAHPWRLSSAIRSSRESLLASEPLLGPAIALSALAWEAS